MDQVFKSGWANHMGDKCPQGQNHLLLPPMPQSSIINAFSTLSHNKTQYNVKVNGE